MLIFISFEHTFSYDISISSESCQTDPFLNTAKFFIDVEGFEAKPVKIEYVGFFGNIFIERRTYKSAKGNFKVRLYKGKELINNWKSLLFALTGFSENELRPLQIDDLGAKLYEKENYKAIIIPVLETQDSGIVIVFSTETFSLEELVNLIKQFPIKNFYLPSCPQN